MTKLIDFTIGTVDGPRPAKGYRVSLMVGTVRRKFVLQMDCDRPSILADERSGYRLANLNGLRLERFLNTGYVPDNLRSWRTTAQLWLDRAVRDKGQEHVLTKLDAAPAVQAAA